MTIQEFKKVGRLLKEVYAELEKEALSEGVDIFSDDYLKVRDMVRLKVLENMGFTLDEYRAAKELVAPAKKVDVATQLENVATKASELESNVQNLHIPDEEDLLAKAKVIAEAVVKAPIIQNNIVERTTKVVEKPTYIHTKETINKETDLNPIYAELGYLNDKLDNLEIPEPFDPKELLDHMRSEFSENLEKNIDTMGMPDFRKLAMGLQSQIDDVRNSSSGLPSQTGNSGKFLTTDGSDASWGTPTGSGDMLGSNNLSELTNTTTARTNLGLGSAAVANTGDFAPALGADDNYVTDAEKVIIGNTSGTNTGDNAVNTLYSGLEASKQDVLTGLTASVLELNYIDGVTSAIQTQLDNKLDDTQFSGLSKITVGTVAPVTPSTGDLWVDTN